MQVSAGRNRQCRVFPLLGCRGAAVVAIAAALAPTAAFGQSSKDDQKRKEQIIEESRRVFGDKSANTGEQDAEQGAWSILIAIFRGEDQEKEAAAALAQVRTKGQLPEALAQKRGEATCILVGSFKGPDDAAAKAELERVQQMVIDGVAVYAASYLAPPPKKDLKGSIPEYNLTQAKLLYGKRAVQTLQVGVYGREDIERPTEKDLRECRAAAEAAVIKLRQEGELAFYYHGPRRSMVTVGVFDLTDFDPRVPSYKSSRLRETQKRFPYNLYNGQAIRVRTPGQPARLQPSNLVAIPEK